MPTARAFRLTPPGSDRLRWFVSTIIGIVAVLAIAGGGLLGYLSDALFDADEFSRRAAESLDDPRVSGYAAARVTDEILAKYRDLTPYRPLLLAGTQAMISSAPFRAVARRAFRRAHQAVMSRTVESAIVSLDDIGLLLKSALATQPELAQKIPKSAEAVLARMQRSPALRTILEVLRLGERLRTRAMLVFFGGFVALGLALWFAPDRRRGLFRSGLALLALGAFLLILVRFGGWVFILRARDPSAGQALAGLWEAFGGRLWSPGLGFCGIGIVLTAAATSTLERVRLNRLGRRAWRWFLQPPREGNTRIGRALLVAAIGLAAVWHPTTVSHLIVFLLGAGLVFLGLEEAFRHLMPAPVPATVRPRSSARRGRAVWTAAAAAAVLLGLAVGAVTFFVRPWDRAEKAVLIEACNGMPELCDRRLDEVVFATTHNAMSSADIATWMFPNQERGIAAQLDDGIRAFMLDVHAGRPVGDFVRTEIENEEQARAKYVAAVGPEGVEAAMRIRDRLVGGNPGALRLYLAHAFCELGSTSLDDALREMREFLVAHPSEVVIVIFEDAGASPEQLAQAFAESGLDQLVYRGPARAPWPTLGELVARDERVLVLAESGRPGVPWIHPAFSVLQETPYSFKDSTQFSNTPNRGGTSGSLRLMNHWIDTAPRALPSNAERVNAYRFLMRRIERYRNARGRVPNLIAVDFYRSGDVLDVVRDLNRSGAGETPPAVSAK